MVDCLLFWEQMDKSFLVLENKILFTANEIFKCLEFRLPEQKYFSVCILIICASLENVQPEWRN